MDPTQQPYSPTAASRVRFHHGGSSNSSSSPSPPDQPSSPQMDSFEDAYSRGDIAGDDDQILQMNVGNFPRAGGTVRSMSNSSFSHESDMSSSTVSAASTTVSAKSPTFMNGVSGQSNVDGHAHPPNGAAQRLQRPSGPARTPSSTYAPIRFPVNISNQSRTRSASATRKKDPSAQYHAQESAYVRRLRQAPASDYFDSSALFYSTSEAEDESPLSEMQVEQDGFDNEVLLMFGQDDVEPSEEELKIPENLERLEWHAMLSSVLNGDVVKQEKKRIGSTEERGGATYKAELFIGVKARCCGRSIAAEKRVIEDGKADLDQVIDDIINFEIKGRDKTEQSPQEQVKTILERWEKHASLFPSSSHMRKAKPRCGSPEFNESYSAIVSWWNITNMINTELQILEKWVGNSDLNFSKRNIDPESGIEISFLDRILKEDGLKSLVRSRTGRTVIEGISKVVSKAKETFIENSEAFKKRHLPLFIEELLVLINFPTKLIEQVINVRLAYAKKMKDPTVVMVETLIEQLHIILRVGVQVKQEYLTLWTHEPGWQLPECMDENFEPMLMEALRFYFRLLQWLAVNQNSNSFEGAELLEREWLFAKTIGRFVEEGDMLVAEQFSSLTSKLLARLNAFFELELQKKPERTGAEFSKRFKNVLDTVRVGQRRLFRFARELSQRFENATEYNVEPKHFDGLIASLISSGHFLLLTDSLYEDNILMIADPTLYNKSDAILSIVRASFQDENAEGPASVNPHYVLLLYYEDQIAWDGKSMVLDMRTPPNLDIKPGQLRLVAGGSLDRLVAAREAFRENTNHTLDITVEQRANLSSVNHELFKIKRTTYKLSNSIMDSVEKIRQMSKDMGCQELIHTCFNFATEFGQRSVMFMDMNRRAVNNMKLAKLAIDWVSFIVDDCVASNRQTFKWAVTALEFAMLTTRGQYILSINQEEYARLRLKVAGCMSLLISHFDIMGARSNLVAQAEKERVDAMVSQLRKLEVGQMLDDEEMQRRVSIEVSKKLEQIDNSRKELEMERRLRGRVLDDKSGMDKSLTILTSSFSNVTLRWQQGQFLGGGSFGSVYAAINLDTGGIMAVKEIRLQDPQMTPQIAASIRDEMRVLEVLDHPNIVSYIGIEVHRDKVYLFMEYCGGGSLAQLLEHGRIEDETVLMIYALQLLEGLAYLHASNVVHRDIKPENILLDNNGVIKYVDFGAAKVIARSGKTRAFGPGGMTKGQGNSMTGTPMYMSPEAITGGNRDNYSAMDVWSLGCVILEAATGRKPWVNLDNEWAIMWNIAGGQKPTLPTPDQLSPAGIDFLNRCFERDPSKRATAPELLQHEWIAAIKSKVIEPTTPSSDTSSNSGR